MTLHNLANEFLKICLSDDNSDPATQLLKKVNRAPGHFVAVSDLSPEELTLAEYLFARRYLDRIPAGMGVSMEVYERGVDGEAALFGPKKYRETKRKLPDRYVVTNGGAYALQTFKHDTLRRENKEREAQKLRIELEELQKKRIHLTPEDTAQYELEEEEDWGPGVKINKTLSFPKLP